MKSRYYTIQIIPETTGQIRKFRVFTKWFVILKMILIILILLIGIVSFYFVKLNKNIADYEKIKVINAQLVKENENYQEIFSHIDSLWTLESKIQNIFQTYIENDSNTIRSIINKNKFAHTPSKKIKINYDGQWISTEEKLKQEYIPTILPTVGIVSKKFTKEGGHLGTDISAPIGHPIFATASGVVEFVGKKANLGNTIVIDHKNGYKTSYSHMKEIRAYKKQQVNKGDIIGSVGNTGTTSGPHLHYTISHNEKFEDPETFFNY